MTEHEQSNDEWPAPTWWEEADLVIVFTAVMVALLSIAVAAAAGFAWARFIFLVFHYTLVAALAVSVLALLAAGLVQAWAWLRNRVRRQS
jgi:hypothetical protein